MSGLPGTVNYGTVTGKLLTAEQVAGGDPEVDGVPVVGKVTFVPSVARIIHATAKTLIAPKPIVCDLAADGSFTTMLVATDDPDLNPTGWTYEVKFELAGVAFKSFSISVPMDSTLDLATLTPVPSASGTYYLVGPAGPAGATGPAGPAGPEGPQGPAGATGPAGADGADGATGPAGPAGPAGATGPAGPAGADGADGNTIYSGSGAPSAALGVNGDYYIDDTAKVMYGPKAAGAWPAGFSIVGPTGPTGPTGATGPAGPSGTARQSVEFSNTGTVAVTTGTHRWYNTTGQPLTITAVRASVGAAPAGSALIVDVNKGGTTIFTTASNRPSIAAGANTATAAGINVATVADGEYLTVDIDQVGSSTAGSDLTVQIVLEG